VNLLAANTHAVANTGAWVGGAGVVAAVAAFFKVLSTPTIVLGFTYELQTHQFGPNGAAIVCSAVAIVGALVVGLLLSRYGRPETVPASPPEAPK
jgi:hypothetical protein